MRVSTSFATAGFCAAVVAATIATAQDGGRADREARAGVASADGTLIVPGTLEWMTRSDLSAEREGVLKIVNIEEGSLVKAGDEIARLNDAVARLTVAKQEVIAKSEGAIRKSRAQKDQSVATLARFRRLRSIDPGYASDDEIDKATADVNYADALVQEARDNQAANQKDLELAQEALNQHGITAPYNGVIIKRLKHPGEALQANEAVVRIGATDKFKFVGWVSLENGQRIRSGDAVQFRPLVDNVSLSVEEVVFNGKVIAVGSEIPQVGEPLVSVTAEIVNDFDAEHPELSLLQGLKGELTISPRIPAAQPVAARRPAAKVDPAVSSASRNR